MAAREQRRAFTLLEMLVALALVSIMAGALYASLHIGFRARRGVEEAVRPARRAHLAMELVRKDIESALPPTGILAGEFIGQDLVDEAGHDADVVLFHASGSTPKDRPSSCDVRRIELALTLPVDEDAPVLVRRTTFRLLAPETPQPMEEVLCRHVFAFNLRYFDGSQWLDAWDSTVQDNALPVAVELTIKVERDAAEQDERAGYRVVRIFVLPCSTAAEGTDVAQVGSGM